MRGAVARRGGVGTLLLLLLLGPAVAGDLDDILKRLASEEEPAARISLVRRLGNEGTARAAAELARVVRRDAAPEVRVEAAQALGRLQVPEASELLVDLLAEGGIRGVRSAVATALARREGGRDAVFALLDARGADRPGKILAVRALGRFGDPASRHRLLTVAAGKDPDLVAAAIAALGDRADGGEDLPDLLLAIAKSSRDAATALALLDLVERRPGEAFRGLVDRLSTYLEPPVKEAAAHAAAVLDFAKAKAAAAAAAKEGYAPGGGPPTPPPPRPRFDVVCAFDTTGSVSGHLDSIRAWVRGRYDFLVGLGADVRVGVVAFRDARRHAGYAPVEVLPLTHDLDRVGAFLDGLKTGGADSAGAGVSSGVAESLDRMAWRFDATRAVYLVADTRCDDPGDCARRAALHRRADGTRLNVLYLLRTRGSVPDDVKELAAAGGGRVEILE